MNAFHYTQYQKSAKHCLGVVKGNINSRGPTCRQVFKQVGAEINTAVLHKIHVQNYHGPKSVSETNFHSVVPKHSQSNNR